MSILRVGTFEATAEVDGKPTPVGYDAAQRRLWVECDGADLAIMLLRRLGAGERAIDPSMPQGEQEVVVAAGAGAAYERAQAQAGEAPATTSPGDAVPQPQVEHPGERKARAAAKRRGSARPATVQDDVRALASEPEPAAEPQAAAAGVEQAPPAQTVQAQEPPVPPPASEPVQQTRATAPGNGVPAELVDAKKIRDIVSILYDGGTTAPDDIVARCLAVKDEVPVLARIRNVEERVRRAITVMGLDG